MASLDSTQVLGDLVVTGAIHGAGGTVVVMSNTATNLGSVAFGKAAQVLGDASIAAGISCTVQGNNSSAFGIGCGTGLDQEGGKNGTQVVVGKWNYSMLAPMTNSQISMQPLFVVGMGTASARKNAFRVDGDGAAFLSKTLSQNQGDFAEFFEWEDGNPNNEDRRGLFVTLHNDKIRIAEIGEDFIGVISGAPQILGNAAFDEWQDKYLKDVFGENIYEEETIINKNNLVKNLTKGFESGKFYTVVST